MNIEILSKKQSQEFIKEEMKKVEINLFQELNKMRKQILRLYEENQIQINMLLKSGSLKGGLRKDE